MSSPSSPRSEPDLALTDGRRQRSARSRRRIADAAYRLLVERGYAVPIGDIALEAGVAVQTVYVAYRTKVALAQAALERAVLGDAAPLPPHRQPWFATLREVATPAEAIRIWVENTLPIYARVGPLAGVFLAEPDLADTWAHSERLRLDGFREAMEVVAAKGGLRPGMDVERATDVMFVLLGPLDYQEFVARRRWPPSDWGEWVARTLTEALFRPG
jgi:AcrR family transcriptional regulator